MSWENIFKVKVQGSTLRLLLLVVGSIPGFRVLSTPGWQMTGTVVLSFFYFFNCFQIDQRPRCISQRGVRDSPSNS